jgi:hypothetical protein
MTALSLDSRLAVSPDVVSQELEGELVILSLDRAEYYGLNRTGTRVWQWLLEGASIGTMAEQLAVAHRVGADRARNDVLALAQTLLDEGLATLVDVPPSP